MGRFNRGRIIHSNLASNGHNKLMSIGIKGSGEAIQETHPRLDKLIAYLEEMDTWDGDNPGLQEDVAHASQEAIEKIKELKELLDELELTY